MEPTPTLAEAFDLIALAHTVGRAISCPGCRAIMDCRRAVTVDCLHEGKLLHTMAFCGQCKDTQFRTLEEAEARIGTLLGVPVQLEILDGRNFTEAQWKHAFQVRDM